MRQLQIISGVATLAVVLTLLSYQTSVTKLPEAESIEVLRSLLFPLDYQVTYVPRMPDSLAHFLESPMGFVMGMVLDASEYGSAYGAENPTQMVRQLHDRLGSGPHSAEVVVVSLDEVCL